MPHLGLTELVIILLIVVVLFGVGRIGKLAGEMGRGIREFRRGLAGDDERRAPPKAGGNSTDTPSEPPDGRA